MKFLTDKYFKLSDKVYKQTYHNYEQCYALLCAYKGPFSNRILQFKNAFMGNLDFKSNLLKLTQGMIPKQIWPTGLRKFLK